MKTPTHGRVLIADDQPDVLEALRLLLKGKASSWESWLPLARGDPGGARIAREFDVVLMDLRLHSRHYIGAGGVGSADSDSGDRRNGADRGDDGLGQCRSGGRGDATRRARFYSEAVG